MRSNQVQRSTQATVLSDVRARIAQFDHSGVSPECARIGAGVSIERGCLHEWFGGTSKGDSGVDCQRSGFWVPPIAVLLGVVSVLAREGGVVVWVGRRCWPLLQSLIRVGGADPAPCDVLYRRCLFLDPVSRADRVWATELAVCNPAVAVVITDGSGITMAESRRVQLAAARGGVCVLLARAPWEVRELSAARTRWSVSSLRTVGNEQAWTVELLRCKGVQPERGARRWSVRRDHATGTIGEWTMVRERSPSDVGVAADGFGRFLSQAGIG